MNRFPTSLLEKYQDFRNNIYLQNAAHYAELGQNGQKPEVMIISCCDSRVDPEAIFASLPGELFVARNVANLVPPYETTGTYHGVSAAIEFAVLNLLVKHIVVLGHSGCGGVMAAIDGSKAIQTEANFISKWMSILDEPKKKVMASKCECTQYSLEQEGIKHSINNLRTFPFIKELEDNLQLEIHGAHFNIEKGELYILDKASDEFKNV